MSFSQLVFPCLTPEVRGVLKGPVGDKMVLPTGDLTKTCHGCMYGFIDLYVCKAVLFVCLSVHN